MREAFAVVHFVRVGCSSCEQVAGYAAQIRQLDQWRYWISTWDASAPRSQEAIKLKIRAGVPPCLRGAVWQQIMEVQNFRQQGEG